MFKWLHVWVGTPTNVNVKLTFFRNLDQVKWEPDLRKLTNMEDAQSDMKEEESLGVLKQSEDLLQSAGVLRSESERVLSVQDAWAIYRQIRFQEQTEEIQLVSAWAQIFFCSIWFNMYRYYLYTYIYTYIIRLLSLDSGHKVFFYWPRIYMNFIWFD